MQVKTIFLTKLKAKSKPKEKLEEFHKLTSDPKSFHRNERVTVVNAHKAMWKKTEANC